MTTALPRAVSGMLRPTGTSGRLAWSLIWATSRSLSVALVGWIVLSALSPAAVVIALGVVVGTIPSALQHGLVSPDGDRLWGALVVAAVVYAISLVLSPVGTAIGTAAKSRITGRLQKRLLDAVSGPVGTSHLDDPAVLDRLARAEGSLTGYFPGDAPVSWAGILSSRIAGVVGCAVVSIQIWWLGILLLAVWLFVRWLVLDAVIRQATELRSQAAGMRYAWYLIGVGTKARDAKEVRVFGLADFVASRFRREYRATIDASSAGLQMLHRRVAIGFLIVLAGYAVALTAIIGHAEAVAAGGASLASLAVVLPMLAVTSSAGSVALDDITLAWALNAIPDVESLERDLTPTAPTPTTAAATIDLNRVRNATAPAASGATTAAPAAPTVRFESVRFHYPNSPTDVLRGVDLELTAGQSTAIVGLNGAGKSTLVSLLARLNEPTGGRILAGGADIRALDPVAWQRSIALMPQNPARFPLSAYDNIALGSPEHADDRAGVEAAAERSGFAEVVERLTNGWDTVLAKQLPGGTDLSGGQWQRLALARSLFAAQHGAGILILDEPTVALDAASEARFYGQFVRLTRGLTTVLISHRFATVRRADTICVLQDGVITERGSHDELVEHGGSYAELYHVQAERFRTAGA